MNESSSASLRWLFTMAAEHKIKLWISMLLASVSALCGLAPFIFVFFLLEQMLAGTLTVDSAWPLAASAIAFMLARYLLLMGSVLLSHKAAFAIQYQVRSQALAQLSKLPLGYFGTRSSGKIKKILSEDIERVELFVAHHIPDFITALVSPLAVFSLLLFIDVRMAFIALIPLPLAVISQAMMYRGFAEKSENYHRSLEQLNTSVTEYMRAMPVIRAFNAGTKPNKQLEASLEDYHQLVNQWIKDAGWPFAFFKSLLDSGLLIMLPAGIYFWSQGTLDIASLTLCILLGVGMMEPLYNLTMLSGYLNQIFEGVKRLQSLLNSPPLPQAEHPKTVTTTDVTFDNVTFRYQEEGAKVVDGVSFHAAQGSLTAIVGPSGAGKSTLALLLARFYDVAEGSVRLGGEDIRDLSRHDLMEHVAFVFQDSIMLNMSVRDNIIMGQEASEESIIAAAKAAQAHDFIQQLPQGYDTPLGEGISLSGGEKQRLAIARAIFKNAPVLILDEATAFADANNQALIQEALNALIQEKTVFVIAHRLSTITQADQILVMEQGQLVGQGSHASLLEHCPVYHTLWQAHQGSKQWHLSTHEESDVAMQTEEGSMNHAHPTLDGSGATTDVPSHQEVSHAQ